jgi:hypothetical protein
VNGGKGLNSIRDHLYCLAKYDRLVANLIKIDAYISLFQGKPTPTALQHEELDVRLPWTFAMWNAYGLNVYYERNPKEPQHRERRKLLEIAHNPEPFVVSQILVEDIQLALCGMLPSVWRHAQLRRCGSAVLPSDLNEESLSRRLDAWKLRLDEFAAICQALSLSNGPAQYPLRAYLGEEDQKTPSWRLVVLSRVTSLVSEATVFYHLLSLHIYADVQTLSNLAKNALTSGSTAMPDSAASTTPDQIAQLRQWAVSKNGRRALSHGLVVLRTAETAPSTQDFPDATLHAMTYLTLVVSAIVVWSWLMNSGDLVECTCLLGLDPDQTSVYLDTSAEDWSSGLEQWVESGALTKLDGVPLCKCAAGRWMARFEAVLPKGTQAWGLSGRIAPMLRLQAIEG